MEKPERKNMKTTRNTRTNRREAGFSLIELMIVIGIMGLLIGIVGPKLMENFDKAKVETTRVNMKNISSTLKQYRLDCGLYPNTNQGLDALMSKPSGSPECKNYAPKGYLSSKTLPKDAWEQDYLYQSEGSSFEIKSLGADRKEGGSDYDTDIIVTDQD
jgi:general secretion pathway protein G